MSFTESIDSLIQSGNPLLSCSDRWKRVPLRSVATIINGYAFSSAAFNHFSGMPLIRIRDIDREKTEVLFNGKYDNAYLVNAGDLLVGMDGDFKCALWKGPTGLLNQRVCKLNVDGSVYSRKLLAYLLPGYLKAINSSTSSITVKHLSSRTLEDIPVPMPSLTEQHQILAEIEKHLTRLQSANCAVRSAQTKVEKYLNSALPSLASLSGDFTRDGASELPSGWVWARIEELGEVKLGRQRSPSNHSGPNMRPYLRVANVFEDRIDIKSVHEMNFSPQEYETFRLQPGDVLLNEGQSLNLVGRAAIYEGEVPGACFQNTLIRYRTGPRLRKDFALLVFRAYLRTGRFQRIAKWTTNIAHLGASRLAQMYFPLPPLAIQDEIIDQANRDLTLLSDLTRQLNTAHRRANRLGQAILSKAFSGQLIRRDQADEAAPAYRPMTA